MLDKQLIVGVYDSGDKLLETVKKLRKRGVEIFDCYTPYPVHNLDNAMGIKRSNLTIGAFLCGLTGFILGLLLQFYTMTDTLGSFKSWPMNIGGKPHDHLMTPSMVPVTFESTILLTAFGIGILFFIRTKMIHGKIADIIDPRQTDDRLFVAIEQSELTKVSRAELDSMLTDNGDIEIRERNLSDTAPVAPSAIKEEKAEEVELSEKDKSQRMSILSKTIGTADESAKQDLKLITGVGPVYEGKLNQLGIYRFEQVAKLNAEAIRAIEELTKYFPGKIEREDWVGQAKKLMNS